jgi:arsenite methyltransferase
MATAVSAPEIRDAVRGMFDRVAETPRDRYRFAVGPALAQAVGYPEPLLASLPGLASESFTGLACLHPFLKLQTGEHVLDLGCGAGLDSMIASAAVVPGGTVTGLDLSEGMITKARTVATQMGATNVRFERGEAETMPFRAETFDAAYANGLLNLCPDKPAVARELCRVVKSGGRAVVAEITFKEPLPAREVRTVDDWFR